MWVEPQFVLMFVPSGSIVHHIGLRSAAPRKRSSQSSGCAAVRTVEADFYVLEGSGVAREDRIADVAVSSRWRNQQYGRCLPRVARGSSSGTRRRCKPQYAPQNRQPRSILSPSQIVDELDSVVIEWDCGWRKS